MGELVQSRVEGWKDGIALGREEGAVAKKRLPNLTNVLPGCECHRVELYVILGLLAVVIAVPLLKTLKAGAMQKSRLVWNGHTSATQERAKPPSPS